jgi:hypothetical protein
MSKFLAVVFSFVSCAAAWAQATSQISGTVRDQSGLIIPGAEIKATQTGTGAVRTASSGADGGFVIPNLPIGPYLLDGAVAGRARHARQEHQLDRVASVQRHL